MTKHPELFAALCAPFADREVKAREGDRGGRRQYRYVTARTVANRLDTVLGPENWWDAYRAGGDASVVCALTLRLPDGSEIVKEDAGGSAGLADAGDDDKSAHSDAFKRAAAKWGVGRYLYGDGAPSYREPTPAPEAPAPAPANGHPKARRDWPAAQAQAQDPAAAPAGMPPPSPAPAAKAPRSGKALFAWVKDQEQRYEVGLLKYLGQWAKLQDFPGRMVEWDAGQVGLAYQEACRKLASIESQEVPS